MHSSQNITRLPKTKKFLIAGNKFHSIYPQKIQLIDLIFIILTSATLLPPLLLVWLFFHVLLVYCQSPPVRITIMYVFIHLFIQHPNISTDQSFVIFAYLLNCFRCLSSGCISRTFIIWLLLETLLLFIFA